MKHLLIVILSCLLSIFEVMAVESDSTFLYTIEVSDGYDSLFVGDCFLIEGIEAQGNDIALNNFIEEFCLYNDRLEHTDLSQDIDIGFDFNFFNQTYSSFQIAGAGFLTFQDLEGSCCGQPAIPDESSPNNLIAFGWHDLQFDYSTSDVKYVVRGEAPNRIGVLEIERSSGDYEGIDGIQSTTQIQLYEESNEIVITFLTLSEEEGLHLIGIENSLGNIGLTPDSTGFYAGLTEKTFKFRPSVLAFDVGIKLLDQKSAICPREQSVDVTFNSFGRSNLDSLVVGWQIDGVDQPDFLCSLQAGDTTLTLGTLSITEQQTKLVKAWIKSIAGGFDTYPFNDSTEVGFNAGMAGSYTVGTGSSDFNSIKAAVDTLTKYGMCESVVFNIEDGSYSEQLVLSNIPKSDPTLPLTIQSVSGDSSTVEIYSGGTTLSVSNMGYVNFRNLTIRTTGTNAAAVSLDSESYQNEFSNNWIVAANSTTFSPSRGSVVYCRGNKNTFRNNRIENGSFGIALDGGFGQPASGNQIIENIIANQNRNGINIDQSDSLTIQGNQIFTTRPGSTYSGIELEYSDFTWVSVYSNKISASQGTGISVRNCSGTTASPGLIANNFIAVRGRSGVKGIDLNDTRNFNLYHNNVNLYSGSLGHVIYTNQSCSNLRLVNNNLIHSGGGLTCYIATVAAFAESNYNNLYTTGNQLGLLNGDVANLSDWQIRSQLDENSISVNPFYTSNTDLHISKAILDSAGRYVPEVITDIDGETRSTIPDIGADEFIAVGRDIAILSAIVPTAPFIAGEQPIAVVIQNTGSQVEDSIQVTWELKGQVAETILLPGTLQKREIDTVFLTNYSFEALTPLELKAWAYSELGVTDDDAVNDTIQIKDVYAAMGGDYTIGPDRDDDFADLNTMATILNNGGVIAPVNLSIAPGTYEEKIILKEIPGASSTNQIVMKSSSGNREDVIIKATPSSSSNYLVKLVGTDHFTIQDLTFETGTSNSYGTIIEMENGNDSVHFINNNFIGHQSTTFYGTRTNYALIKSDVLFKSNSHQRIEGNVFNGGSYGLYIGKNSQSLRTAGMVIRDNVMENQYNVTIDLGRIDSLTIEGNTISKQVGDNYGSGIRLSVVFGIGRIVRNKIAIPSGDGIDFSNCFGTNGSPGLVANNFIAVFNEFGSGSGIDIYNSGFLNFYHNSVNISGSDLKVGSNGFRVNRGNDLNLRNNIFANNVGGKAINISSDAIITSDFNNLYVTGDYIGSFGSQITDLVAWKVATNMDSSSVSEIPEYLSTKDLHTNSVKLDEVGTPIASVTVDIDNEPRSDQTPDIGADEFEYRLKDIGIGELLSSKLICGLDTTYTLEVEVVNYGGLSQTDVGLAFVFGEDTVQQSTGPSPIARGEKANIIFDTPLPVSDFGTFALTVYTSLDADDFTGNDTLQTTIKISGNIIESVSNMFPEDQATELPNNLSFSWSPVVFGESYDLYVWPQNEPKPADPLAANLEQINYRVMTDLSYGQTYSWQVIAKNECSQTESIIQSFTTRNLPDLKASEVNIPSSAFSGEKLAVNWTVENNGTGGTGSSVWFDKVYLSGDNILDTRNGQDTYLGGKGNFSALEAGDEYLQSAELQLPEGIEGSFYVFVVADQGNRLREENESNNTSISDAINIRLTPPPNLEVVTLNRPNNTFSGQEISIGWVVKNTGPGPSKTGRWNDEVYLSADSVLSAAAIRVSTTRHDGVLTSDDEYSNNITFTIPPEVFGNYYIIIKTDTRNEVFEYVFENDNVRISEAMNIVLLPPPDYQVTSVSTPTMASNQDTVLVEWEVSNLGGSATNATQWRDVVYLANSANQDLSEALLLTDEENNYNRINPGESYQSSALVYIPRQLTEGDYYFLVQTDADGQVYEFENEDNNTGSSDAAITIVSPNLRAGNLQIDGLIGSGELLKISWINENLGQGMVYDVLWTDSVYLSPTPDFNTNTAIALGGINHMQLLAPGDNLSAELTIQLPNGIAGSYYLLIAVDDQKTIFEGEESDNLLVSNVMNIALSPSPDFIALTMVVDDTIRAGNTKSITYTVRNEGNGPSKGSWEDELFISEEAVWTPRAQFITSRTTSRVVATGNDYTQEISFVVPPELAEGEYYLHIYVDGEDEVYEHLGEANNILSQAIQLTPYPSIDLSVNNVVFTGNTESGGNATITYSVRNQGLASTFVREWKDAIYLSSDSVWNEGDRLIKELSRERALDAGETYTMKMDFLIPDGIQGVYHFLAVTDHGLKNIDIDGSNNFLSAKDTTESTVGGGITITLKDPIDLVVSEMTSPEQANSGQPFVVSWTVVNQGTGTTVSNQWSDKVFLSSDFILDKDDLLLASKVRNRILQADSSYTVSATVTTAVNIEGNFILLVDTDHNNAQYEHLAEENNLHSQSIILTKATIADLQVTDIIVPDTVLNGAPATLSWVTKNTSENGLSAFMTEALFLSQDTVWELSDALIATYSERIVLAPGEGRTKSVITELPGVPLGDYHLLVKTDILNNVYETDNNNNTGYSTLPLNVTVPDWPIGTTISRDLSGRKLQYYKIEVPESLIDESLELILKGDSINGNNELYVQFMEVPDRVSYDFKHEIPFSGNQQVIIPALKGGTYYVMVIGDLSGGNSQNIVLNSKILNFEIRTVNSSQGGNTGFVTAQLRGAKFDPGMQVVLHMGQDSIPADSLIFANATQVFVRFNLAGRAIGTYDVTATNTKGESFTMVGGFEVISGGVPDLVTNLIKPASTRPGWKIELKIQFFNNGKTDLIDPKIRFVSDGAPIALSRKRVVLGQKELVLELKELEGPKGILRPGAGGTVTIYTQATEALNFIIYSPKTK